jgi:hypothetical protein
MMQALKTLNGFAALPFSPAEWLDQLKLGWRHLRSMTDPILMLAAQILNIMAFTPILWQVITTHKPSGTPVATLVMFIFIQVVFMRSGYRKKDWFMAGGMFIAALMVSATIILSLYYA